MIISDLNYLEEVVVESNDVEGGILNFGSGQTNQTPIGQSVNTSTGNGLFSLANLGLGVNVAVPLQLNL